MTNYMILLITTLHGTAPNQYTLDTALRVSQDLLESEGIYDIYDPRHRAWLLWQLPMHAKGNGIVRIDEIFEMCEAVKHYSDDQGDDKCANWTTRAGDENHAVQAGV